jgi:hypothetical protein
MKALEIFNTPTLPESILAKANNIPASYSQKIDHVATLMNMINAEAKKLKQQETVIATQRKSLEALVSQAEDSLKEEMSLEGLCEIQGELIKYTLSASNPRLVIEDEKLIPQEYKRDLVVTEIRKDAIKDELKMGTVIPGCKLEQGTTLKQMANKE